MNKTLFGISILLFSTVQILPAADPSVPQLMAYWALDGNTQDSSGNNWHASAVNIAWNTGRLGQAAYFNGSDTVADCGRVPLVTGKMTLAFWVLPYEVQNDWQGYFIKGTQNDNNDPVEKTFRVYNMNTDGQLVFAITAGGTYYDFLSSGAVLFNNQWTHIVLTYDGTFQRIYVDGLLNSISTDRGGPLTDFTDGTGSGPMLMGRTLAVLSAACDMDEVRLYNYALSPVEVSDLFLASGGTEICVNRPRADLNRDCLVNLEDLAVLCSQWLTCNLYPTCTTDWL